MSGSSNRGSWRTTSKPSATNSTYYSASPIGPSAPNSSETTPTSTDFNNKSKLTDLEYEAAIAQQQSIYDTKPAKPPSGDTEEKKVTVQRSGGGKTWTDTSLLEWDSSHFRLFIGNLSHEVTDDMVSRAFSRFSSMSKVRVVRDAKTGNSKGYGFVSFANPDDYFKAFKEVNGKYIGNHPVQLKKAQTDVKPTQIGGKNDKKKQKNNKYKKSQKRSTPYERLA